MGGNFLVTVFIARMLGIDVLGSYVYAKALTLFIHAIMGLGLVNVVIREIAQKPSATQIIASNSITIRLFVTIPATFIVAYAVSYLLPIDDTTQKIIWLVALIDGIGNTTGLLNGVFLARSQFEYPLLITFVRRSLILLAVYFLPRNGYGIVLIIASFTVIHGFTLIGAWALVNYKVASLRLRFNRVEWARLLRMSLPLTLSNITYATNSRADSVLIGTIHSINDVGIYSAAYNIYLGLVGIINSVALGAFPILSEKAKLSHRQALRLSFQLGLGILFGTSIIAVVGILLSDWIMLNVYGSELVSATNILRILLVAMIFSSLSRLCQFALISLSLQKLFFWTTFIGTLFNVCVNLALIPRYGYLGATYTTLATEFIILIISVFFLIRHSLKATSA